MARAEAALQVLRNGGHARAQEHRDGDHGHEDQHQRGHQLIVRHADAAAVGRARHADERGGRDVGREQREPHGHDAQAAPGEEQILARGAGTARRPGADEQHDHEVGGDHRPVPGAERGLQRHAGISLTGCGASSSGLACNALKASSVCRAHCTVS